jgi:hypothetical protein
MAPVDGERLAVLETRLEGLASDVAELVKEERSTRRRLHNLEGFAQAYLDTQREHRRQEERQYHRLANAIGFGGLALSFGMLALAAVTLFYNG